MNKPIAVGFTIFDCNLERKIVKPTVIGLFIPHSFLVKYEITIFDEGIKLRRNIFFVSKLMCNYSFI